MHVPKAEFLGLYEADADQIFRVRISESETFDANDFSVQGSQGAAARLLIIQSPSSNPAPYTFELSIRMPRGHHAFALLYKGKRIARMNKAKAAMLMIRRNVAMVNPEIDERYQEWRRLNPITIPTPSHGPTFSIIAPLYNTPVPYLHEMIDSVLAQTYQNWELLLINASPNNDAMKATLNTYSDLRIKVIELADNLGIVGNTNIGINNATGDYIAFLDHDDTVDEHLLAAYATHINEHPDTDLLYCDEDNFCETLDDAYGPRFKPDFNLDLLYSHNYVLHCLTVSRFALDRVELSPEYVNGAQDYDLTLKIVEVARSIYHAPYVLYHWRAHAGSTNGGEVAVKPYAIDAGRKALQDHYDRRGVALTSKADSIPCVYEVRGELNRTIPMAIVVIHESTLALTNLLESLRSQEVIAGDRLIVAGPKVSITPQQRDGLPPITTIALNDPSDHAALNALMDCLDTPLTLFCTDEIRFTHTHCLAGLCSMASREEISAVSPKLLYADGLVAQAGQYVLEDGNVVHINAYFTDHMGGGYHGLAECSCNYTLPSSNCFAIKTESARTALSAVKTLNLFDISLAVAKDGCNKKSYSLVNPLYKASIMLKVHKDNQRVRAGELRELLHNHSVDVSSGYMRLRLPGNDSKEVRRQLVSRIIARLHS